MTTKEKEKTFDDYGYKPPTNKQLSNVSIEYAMQLVVDIGAYISFGMLFIAIHLLIQNTVLECYRSFIMLGAIFLFAFCVKYLKERELKLYYDIMEKKIEEGINEFKKNL